MTVLGALDCRVSTQVAVIVYDIYDRDDANVLEFNRS